MNSKYARYWGRCFKKVGALRVGKKSPAQHPGETNQMTERHADFMPGLVDLTSIAFKDLVDLDESLVDSALDRLLPACGGVDSRLWNQGGILTARADDEIRA
ncbi:MAG TPA: hypothetical protein VFI65_03635 [Streptosporangiaceae bacterium]|nr:hypothetical protein [Streptosporangiaceae bacterium]